MPGVLFIVGNGRVTHLEVSEPFFGFGIFFCEGSVFV